MLDKIEKMLISVISIFVTLLMLVLVLDVVWQVLSRYVLNNPSSWTTDLAKVCLIWITFLGANIALYSKGHLGVDFIVSKLSKKKQSIVECFVYLLVGFFTVSVFVFGGGRLVYLTLKTHQIIPALGMKLGMAYLIIPISGVCMTFIVIKYLIQKIVKDL